MDKAIQEHMNRYTRKEFLETKVNGYRTTIYPPEKGLQKMTEEFKERKK
jgi:hypothetical protein